MNVHEASKFMVCRWCCAKFGIIKITSHRAFKETAEEFTQLGEQYTKIFEPLTADQNFLRPNVLCTTCKLYIAKVVVIPLQNSQIDLTGLIFCMRRFNIQRSTYHGNAFEGNSIRKMLKMCNGLAFSPSNSAFIALKRFCEVIASCFGTDIKSEYIEHIYQFEEAFNKTGLPCSTKVHVLCRHIIQFIQNYLPPGKGLRYVSEQAVESSQSRFMKAWNRYKCHEDVEVFQNAYITQSARGKYHQLLHMIV